MTPNRLDPKAANEALTHHPHYKYRGCAPDPDDPRLAAGDPSLSVDAWQAPDVDGGEDQEERAARVEAAKAVCRRCPVLAACAVFGAAVTAEGKLAERHAILGGLTAVERTKALVQERQAETVPVVTKPTPVEQMQTEQKLAVLRGLARHADPEQIALAAGLGAGLKGLRTAKWQLARLRTQLGLPKTASRTEVLEAAVARGLLLRDEVAVEAPVVVSVPGGRRGARGRRVASVPGQLSFFEAGPAMGAAA